MIASVQTIHDFFERYGWQCDFDGETATWVTGFRGKTANFNIMVHLTENWLYFIISPFANAPGTAVCEQRLCQYLLRLNHTINLAKFSVDSDGDVVLTVEIPTEGLTYSQFRDGLNAVSYYADCHYLDVLNLAQSPTYVPAPVADEKWWASDLEALELDKPN
ncbi:MAG: YbjN domain-containing protein [Proteobacteria bacterium]|nr:YbjN domain-containing protein [Pseudomonadota bacterium]